MGTSIVVLAFISIVQALSLRDELHNQVQAQLEALIQDRVSAWEDQLLDNLAQWTENVATEPRLAAGAQRAMRAREAWFDSLYLWTPPQESVTDGRRVETPARVIFPTASYREPADLIATATCLQEARSANVANGASTEAMAEALVAACEGADEPVRLVAATEAVTLLARATERDRALRVLDQVGLPPDLDFGQAARREIDSTRAAVHRLQRAELEVLLGQFDAGFERYYRLGLEIVQQDAPDARPLLHLVDFPIVARLKQGGRLDEARRLELARSRAERRVKAWREISGRILPLEPPEGTSPQPRIIYDQYTGDSEVPFLLYYSWVQDNNIGIALQLDQSLLLRDLLHTLRRYEDDLVVSDLASRYVAGVRRGQEVTVSVPFTRTLTHLRVGLRDTAVTGRAASMSGQWSVPLLIISVTVVLALLMLSAFVRTSRQQRELLERQRDFATRVTHELKTPLAGIRLMAENLEVGAWRTDAQRVEMARRIQQEADRLRERVDEVLAVARTRSVPNPEPFDPEEPLLEVVDSWGPRLETAGVGFTADLEPTSSVLGDATAVRDAVSCLLDNALKYRREDIDDPQVALTLTQQGQTIVIAVTDNGLGVPASHRKRIFERFVRVEGPNRGRSGGHGLGLAQVADIARVHGGAVDCRDGLDGGTTFEIRLPALPDT